MRNKILGLILILPYLSIFIFLIAGTPAGMTQIDSFKCSAITALILESLGLGVYLLFK